MISTEILMSIGSGIGMIQEEEAAKAAAAAEKKKLKEEREFQLLIKNAELDQKNFEATLEDTRERDEFTAEALEKSNLAKNNANLAIERNKALGWNLIEGTNTPDPNAKQPVANFYTAADASWQKLMTVPPIKPDKTDPVVNDAFSVPVRQAGFKSKDVAAVLSVPSISSEDITKKAKNNNVTISDFSSYLVLNKGDSEEARLTKTLAWGIENADDIFRLRDNNDRKPYNDLVQTVNTLWTELGKTKTGALQTVGGKSGDQVRVPLINYMMNNVQDLEPLLKDDDFVEDTILKSLANELGLTPDDVRRQAGVSSTIVSEVDVDGTIPSPVGAISGGLSWAQGDDQTVSADVDDIIGDMATSMRSKNKVDLYGELDDLSQQNSKLIIEGVQESREYYSKPENRPLQAKQSGGGFTLKRTALNADSSKLDQALNLYAADPEMQFALAKASLGDTVTTGFAGVPQGTAYADQVAQEVLKEQREILFKGGASARQIQSRVGQLITLIEDYDQTGGVSGSLATFKVGIKDQAKKILGTFDDRFFASNFDEATGQDLEARQQFLKDRKETLSLLESSDQELSEAQQATLFRALTQALLYDVASMLQGGDFRNISDYDVRLARDAMGGLGTTFGSARNSLATLRSLEYEASRKLMFIREFSSGDVNNVVAASKLWYGAGYDSPEAASGRVSYFVETRVTRTKRPVIFTPQTEATRGVESFESQDVGGGVVYQDPKTGETILDLTTPK